MLNGHWLGLYTGSNSGIALLEIDDLSDHYEGQAFAYDSKSPSKKKGFMGKGLVGSGV